MLYRAMGDQIDQAPRPEDMIASGAASILIHVTAERQAGELRAQAQRCRRLARSVTDQRAIDNLLLMAGEYEDKACSLHR